jgi:hypothetical protein
VQGDVRALTHPERVRIERLLAAGASISGIAIAPENNWTSPAQNCGAVMAIATGWRSLESVLRQSIINGNRPLSKSDTGRSTLTRERVMLPLSSHSLQATATVSATLDLSQPAAIRRGVSIEPFPIHQQARPHQWLLSCSSST